MKNSCLEDFCLLLWPWSCRCSSNCYRHERYPRNFSTERGSRSWSYAYAAGQRNVCSTSTQICLFSPRECGSSNFMAGAVVTSFHCVNRETAQCDYTAFWKLWLGGLWDWGWHHLSLLLLTEHQQLPGWLCWQCGTCIFGTSENSSMK